MPSSTFGPITRAVSRFSSHPTAAETGLVMNLDGDDSFPSLDPAESTRLLRQEILRYADAGVGTLVYSATAGSEVMLYPTKVGVNWGWRPTSYDTKPGWDERIKRCKANQDAQADPLATAAEVCRETGMKFIPALRMNDAHFAFATPVSDYPLAGRFNLENPSLSLGVSPVKSKAQYANLLDFSHAQVRAHRLAQAREIITRYADVMAGFELDFGRFQLFFPPGTAGERAHLLTSFVREVRTILDQEGGRRGTRFALFGRIPPSLECCAWSGMEIQKWAQEGLIDLVSPSLMMIAEFDARIGGLQNAFTGTKTLIYPGVLPRVGFRWEGGSATRDLTAAQLRAIAVNAHSKGADGLYLFNCQHWPRWRSEPLPNAAHAAVKELHDIPGQVRQSLTFAVVKSYWQDHEDTYEYKKQIPVKLLPGQTVTVGIYVGLTPADLVGRAVTLTVGLRDVPRSASAVLNVSLASGEVVSQHLAGLHVPGYGDEPRPADLASHRLQTVIAPHALTQGANQVSLTLEASSPVTVTDLELDVASA